MFLINNAALVSIRDFFFSFKNIQIKILLTLTFLNGNARPSYVTIRNYNILLQNKLIQKEHNCTHDIFQSFQEEVQAHKPLTADVLQTGELLLHCMNSASPCESYYLYQTIMQ